MNLTLRTEQRYVIKHCGTAGITPIDILKFMERGSANCSTRLVIKWHKCFRDGDFNVNNLPRTDRLSRTERDIAWIRDVVKPDRRKTVRENVIPHTLLCLGPYP